MFPIFWVRLYGHIQLSSLYFVFVSWYMDTLQLSCFHLLGAGTYGHIYFRVLITHGIKSECCKTYNILLITIKSVINIIFIIHLYLMDIALLLVVNCKSDIIIDWTLYAITGHSNCIVTCSNLVFYIQLIHRHFVHIYIDPLKGSMYELPFPIVFFFYSPWT